MVCWAKPQKKYHLLRPINKLEKEEDKKKLRYSE